MTLTIKEIIQQNNEKRKLLTPENETFYENMLVYIRTNAFCNERATEEVLLEMLDHLLEAQKEGKMAEEVFGKSPQLLAEEIIETLPKESWKDTAEFSLEIILTLFGWFLVSWGILPLIRQTDQTIHLGSLIVSSLLLIGIALIFIYLIFGIIRKNAFDDKKEKRKATWIYGVLVGLILVVGFGIVLLIEPFGPTVQITYYTAFGLGCFFILTTYLLKRMRETK